MCLLTVVLGHFGGIEAGSFWGDTTVYGSCMDESLRYILSTNLDTPERRHVLTLALTNILRHHLEYVKSGGESSDMYQEAAQAVLDAVAKAGEPVPTELADLLKQVQAQAS